MRRRGAERAAGEPAGLRKYGEFWRALQLVENALVEAERLAAKAVDAQPARASAGAPAHWSTRTPEGVALSGEEGRPAAARMANAARSGKPN
jgi:hypothetical protein